MDQLLLIFLLLVRITIQYFLRWQWYTSSSFLSSLWQFTLSEMGEVMQDWSTKLGIAQLFEKSTRLSTSANYLSIPLIQRKFSYIYAIFWYRCSVGEQSSTEPQRMKSKSNIWWWINLYLWFRFITGALETPRSRFRGINVHRPLYNKFSEQTLFVVEFFDFLSLIIELSCRITS